MDDIICLRVCLVDAHTSPTKYFACQNFDQGILSPRFANFFLQEPVRERDVHALVAKTLATNQTITTTLWATNFLAGQLGEPNQTHPYSVTRLGRGRRKRHPGWQPAHASYGGWDSGTATSRQLGGDA
jgi:hypothetical protein